MSMNPTGPATATLDVDGATPITVIGTPTIRGGFDAAALKQAINVRTSPGVTHVVLNPDAHSGYGAPIGCVMVSPTHVYPGPVGFDMKCSMSLLQLDLPKPSLVGKKERRAVIDGICARIPTGPGRGQRSVPKSRHVDFNTGFMLAAEGASKEVCERLGVPADWSRSCEDAFHRGHDGTVDILRERLSFWTNGLGLGGGTANKFFDLNDKLSQLGSYGGGNHFGEANVVSVAEDEALKAVAASFGLLDQKICFLSHCGSRGFGWQLANWNFRRLREDFEKSGTPLPGGDREMVYAELGTDAANDYLDDMALGANFATVNHLLINSLVLEAFQEVFPGVKGNLVYFISHNIARKEPLDGKDVWVHRKGATRAFPAGHPQLVGTKFEATGHPILLPGNPKAGSVVMVAQPGAALSCYSVNHGAGRALGRRAAIKSLSQQEVDEEFEKHDILTNCRRYPLDEAPAAYKDFEEVLKSVELAGLAKTVATLTARFVIKDNDKDNDKGSATS